jgi:putative RNA 2'-phosphotransferase
MEQKRLVKTSKYLARHLRHEPARLGLSLEPGGWVRVDALLSACRARSLDLTLDDLRDVVERNDKRRFSFDETGTRIRANQGHSVEIDLGLKPARPPAVLYHGTGRPSLDSIMRNGLDRMNRHHVHLSLDIGTALRVGGRHGRSIVLEVAAGRLNAEGQDFYVSDNGVWLTAAVPVSHLKPMWDAEDRPREL